MSNLIEITQDNLQNLFADKGSIVIGKDYIDFYKNDDETYDGFEIKEEITIQEGQILKDFSNIQLTKNIYNSGEINNCTINTNNNSYIYNGYNSNGEINNCIITLNDVSEFYNGYNDKCGKINNCIINLNDVSYIDNGHSGYGEINNNCTIVLNNNSSIYNGYDKGKISESFIFMYDNAIFNNIADGIGTLMNNYLFALDTCQIKNSNDFGNSGIFESTIFKISNICIIDDSIDNDHVKSILEFKILLKDKTELITENEQLKTDKEELKNQILLLEQQNISLNNSSSVPIQKLSSISSENTPSNNPSSNQIQKLYSVNSSSNSIQKLLLLPISNKTDDNLTSNKNKLLK